MQNLGIRETNLSVKLSNHNMSYSDLMMSETIMAEITFLF